MTLLSNPYVLIATASLAIQLVVLFLIIYGYTLKRRMVFRCHGFVMATALFLHLAFVFGIMIPSFVLAILPHYVIAHVYEATSVVTLIHVPLGALAVSLGVWLVASWRFRDAEGCFARKRIMHWTMILWLATLTLGIILYTILYWAVLIS